MSRPPPRQPVWLLLALATSAAPAMAQADWSIHPAYLSPCETTLVDAGLPEARWALGNGVHSDERDRRGRTHAWTGRSWQARLLLTSATGRSLKLTGRRGPPELSLRAWWNGTDLGEVDVGEDRTSVTWEVPAEITRVGLNELRFEASAARELERQLSFRLDRLEVEPLGPRCGPVETATASAGFTLAPGALLMVSTPLPPRAEVDLQLDGAAGTDLEVYLNRDGPRRRIELTTRGGSQIERLDGGDLLADELVVVSRGPGTSSVRLLGISGDLQQSAWRRACGLLWKGPPLAIALLALLVAVVAIGHRWPGGRAVLWLDCVALMALALALRMLYLEAYPEMDPSRFGDSWEYMRRSRYLLRGISFWSDTSWHAWQSWIRPPGYYLLLAAVFGPLTGGLATLAKIQAVLLAATAVCGYLIAHPLFGRGAALTAGLLVAIYPQTITSASWILSDPPSLFLTTAALAGLSWLSLRQRWPLAMVTGVLFGLACLMRSAPLYFVPLAALLLWLAQRPPRRKRPALVLLGAAILVVLPWCVRNSMIYGKPMGIDDLVIPNFLMAHPDPEILPAELQESGVYGEADEVREKYFRALWRGNKRARLTLDSGRILGRGLVRMAASPGTTLERFSLHVKIYFQAFPRFYTEQFVDEPSGCRITWWSDYLNLIYLLSLTLAVPGVVLAVRRRQGWALVAWVLYFVVITNLFFYPSYMPGRYRLPIYPALAALAGLSLSRAVELVAGWRSRRRGDRGA